MSARIPPTGPAQAGAVDARLLSVPKKGPIQVRFLGPISGLNTHHHAGKSRICWQGINDQTCPSTLHRAKPVWKGYAAAESWQVADKIWRPVVLEVTAGLAEILDGRSLRGEVWWLERSLVAGREKEVLGYLADTLDPSKLTSEFTLQPTLCRVYECAVVPLGQVSVLPIRLRLPEVPGAPPAIPIEKQQRPANGGPRRLGEVLPRLMDHYRQQQPDQQHPDQQHPAQPTNGQQNGGAQ